jgi:catabolite regulation protein CreA
LSESGRSRPFFLFELWVFTRPERGTTGSVSHRFHLLGPNDKIVVDGFDDPKDQKLSANWRTGSGFSMSGAGLIFKTLQVFRLFDRRRTHHSTGSGKTHDR